MLNALIAILGDSYSRVTERQKAEMVKSLLSLTVDQFAVAHLAERHRGGPVGWALGALAWSMGPTTFTGYQRAKELVAREDEAARSPPESSSPGGGSEEGKGIVEVEEKGGGSAAARLSRPPRPWRLPRRLRILARMVSGPSCTAMYRELEGMRVEVFVTQEMWENESLSESDLDGGLRRIKNIDRRTEEMRREMLQRMAAMETKILASNEKEMRKGLAAMESRMKSFEALLKAALARGGGAPPSSAPGEDDEKEDEKEGEKEDEDADEKEDEKEEEVLSLAEEPGRGQ